MYRPNSASIADSSSTRPERVEVEVVTEGRTVYDLPKVSLAYLADDVAQAPRSTRRAAAGRRCCIWSALLQFAENRIEHNLLLYFECVRAGEVFLRPNGEAPDPLLLS